MKKLSFASLVIIGLSLSACGALLTLTACGAGGGGGGQRHEDITVSLAPKTVSVSGGETQQFTAAILNPNNTGVNWALAGTGCTGTACGTLGNTGGNNNQGWTVVYTAPLAVPSPATVTLTATSRDDPSKSDTATITVTAPVVKVNLTPLNPTVVLGATQQFTATVTGATNTAVTWSTSGPGSISNNGLYTAPATMHTPGSATVTATSQADNTKSTTTTVSIPAVTIALSPEIEKVFLGGTQQFAATVANATNTAITWTVSGPGTVNSAGLYTAPSTLEAQTTATVTARAQADPDCFRFASFPIIVTPTLTPTSVTVPAGATQQFTADMPVTWAVTGVAGTDPGTWGTISADGLYTAPLGPPWTGKVNITATLRIDPRHAANAVATVVFSNASLQGHYAMRYRGEGFGVASFEADGHGAISSGWVSFDQTGMTPTSVPISGGTYSVSADGRASATLRFQANGESLEFPMRFVLTSHTGGRLIGFDDTGTGWGNIDLQSGLTSPPDLSGTYVFTLDGFDDSLHPIAMAGMFTAAGGTIGSGVADINQYGSISQNVAFAGTYTPLNLYQPSTATLNVSGAEAHFIFYQLNPDTLILISGDADMSYLGVATRQDTSAAFSNESLSGDVIFESTGYTSGDHQAAVALGRFTADGLGNLTDGVVDNIWSHPGLLSTVGYKQASTAVYSIQANGRGTMTISTAGGGYDILAVYLVAPNNVRFVSLYPNDSVSTGQLVPQASGTYDLSIVRGSWGINLRETLYYWPGKDVAGQMTSDAAGKLTGTADVNASGALSPDVALTGTYGMEPNGRGEATLSINGTSVRYAVYVASGRTLFMVPSDATKLAALGVAARQF